MKPEGVAKYFFVLAYVCSVTNIETICMYSFTYYKNFVKILLDILCNCTYNNIYFRGYWLHISSNVLKEKEAL